MPEILQQLMAMGHLLPYAGAINKAPEGWAYCNGIAVSRVSFPKLFALIGTQFGEGDGSTTFNLPTLAPPYGDERMEFIVRLF